MRLEDKIRSSELNKMRLPRLKGHVKVTLHNCNTKKNEVWEGDNIVTNAVRDIFALNYMGGITYSKLLPLYQKWFGGILCYDTAHTLSADNYFPQAGHGLVAHAGDQAPGTAAIIEEDLTRGAPLHVDTTNDDSVTMTWEWGSEQGNGDIAALSLTHKDTGNVGLGNTSSAFKAFNPFDEIEGSQLSNISAWLKAPENTVAQYDDNHGLMFYIGNDGDYNPNFLSSTNKVTVYIKKAAFTKAGLYETINPSNTHVQKFTITTSVTFYCQPAYYFDATNKRLWLFSNLTGLSAYSKKYMNYTVIDCENQTEYAHGTIEALEEDLAPVCMTGSGIIYVMPRYANIVFDGTYFYFPTSSGADFNSPVKANVKGYRRINFNSQADQSLISFNEVQTILRPAMLGGGLIINSGRVCWGNTGYTCANFLPDNVMQYPNYGFNQPYNPTSYVVPIGAQPSDDPISRPRYILANKMVNTTLFNLDSVVHKTTAKALNIQYTLTEV